MFKFSSDSESGTFSTVTFVAFDSANGDVHATYTHGYHGQADDVGIERARERFLQDVRGRVGSRDIDLVQMHSAELEGAYIERVDPATRTAVIRRRQSEAAGISRP